MSIRTCTSSEVSSTEAVRNDSKGDIYVKLRLNYHPEIVSGISRSPPSPRLSDQARLSADECEI